MRRLLQLSLVLTTVLLVLDAPAQAQRGSGSSSRGSISPSRGSSSSRGSISPSRGSSSSRGSISPSRGSSSSRGSSISPSRSGGSYRGPGDTVSSGNSSSRGSSSPGLTWSGSRLTTDIARTPTQRTLGASRGLSSLDRSSSRTNIVRVPSVSAPKTTPRTSTTQPRSLIARGSSTDTGTNSWIATNPRTSSGTAENNFSNIVVLPSSTRTPRVGIPRLSGSSKNALSSARRRAIRAIEEETELPQLQWKRAGLSAPKTSSVQRVPLAGADIFRRYERSGSSKEQSTPARLTPLSLSASNALASRTEFASRVRSNSSKASSSSKGRKISGKTAEKSLSSAASSNPNFSRGAGGMTGVTSLAIGSDIKTTSTNMPHSSGGDGEGSSGGGWDDNFGNGDDDHGNDGCNNCNNDHWCDDHSHHGHGGWWPGWGWNGGWGSHYGWYGWWSYPWYGYGPWWSGSYYTPTVISSTVYTTEIIETPVVYEVPAPIDDTVIADAEIGSSAETQSALQRAAVEYLSLGDRAFAEARYGDAVRHYARSVEFSPEDPVLHLVLSDALFATGDYHYAAHCLRRALELEPDLLEVEFDKRSFYGDPSDFDRHLLLLQSYLADHVLDDDARLLLGANHLFGGNPDETIVLFSDTFGEAVQNSDAGRLLLAAAHRAIAAR